MSTQFKATADVAQQAQPARMRNITIAREVDPRRELVWIPVQLALIESSLVGGLVGYIVGWATNNWWLGFQVGFLVFLVCSIAILAYLAIRNIGHMERITGWDLNGNNQIDPEPGEPVEVDLNITFEGAVEGGGDHFKLPLTMKKLVEMARALHDQTREFSVRGMKGILTDEEFIKVRERMLERDYLEPVNPKYPTKGVKLTSKGRAYVHGIVAKYGEE